jgi:hypothetical protein
MRQESAVLRRAWRRLRETWFAPMRSVAQMRNFFQSGAAIVFSIARGPI